MFFLLFLPIQSSFLSFIFPILSNPSHSFYTCRYLHILIYIPSLPIFPNKLSINIRRSNTSI
jgi:hypothetical protein